MNLTDINLSDKLTTINGLAFYNTGLTEITVPASLTKITTASAAGKNVGPFAGGVLRKVTFADGVTKSFTGYVYGYDFSGRSGITGKSQNDRPEYL